MAAWDATVAVANLADEDDIRILPEDRSQNGRETMLLLVIDRDLRGAIELVLHRILDRDRIASLDVDLAKA